ncbi:LOW QUALITY PROTEIN: cell wall surface anchor family protein [Plakobranchus ocellatus]|uniref:Cell wall surface anchor family protein n=1 Tax=Plakobranchus ocellatus TaxID=259542 RepID=A0AAV4BLQ6_9GAST|nr:LOW QUALITY PROTEIN: cell wall surface anchor family protein [Plakobranchus ocellatus]
MMVWFLYGASPQQGDLGLSSPPSGQGDRRVPEDFRADSLATVLPTAYQKNAEDIMPVHNKVISGFQAHPSGQCTGGETRTCDTKISADLRADLLTTVPPQKTSVDDITLNPFELDQRMMFCGALRSALLLALILPGSLEDILEIIFPSYNETQIIFHENSFERFQQRCLCEDTNGGCKVLLSGLNSGNLSVTQELSTDLDNYSPRYICYAPWIRVNYLYCYRQREIEDIRLRCDNATYSQKTYHIDFTHLVGCQTQCINIKLCVSLSAGRDLLQALRLFAADGECKISTPSPTTTISELQENKDYNHVAAITAGVIVPAIIIVTIMGLVVSFLFRRKRRKNTKNKDNKEASSGNYIDMSCSAEGFRPVSQETRGSDYIDMSSSAEGFRPVSVDTRGSDYINMSCSAKGLRPVSEETMGSDYIDMSCSAKGLRPVSDYIDMSYSAEGFRPVSKETGGSDYIEMSCSAKGLRPVSQEARGSDYIDMSCSAEGSRPVSEETRGSDYIEMSCFAKGLRPVSQETRGSDYIDMSYSAEGFRPVSKETGGSDYIDMSSFAEGFRPVDTRGSDYIDMSCSAEGFCPVSQETRDSDYINMSCSAKGLRPVSQETRGSDYIDMSYSVEGFRPVSEETRGSDYIDMSCFAENFRPVSQETPVTLQSEDDEEIYLDKEKRQQINQTSESIYGNIRDFPKLKSHDDINENIISIRM